MMNRHLKAMAMRLSIATSSFPQRKSFVDIVVQRIQILNENIPKYFRLKTSTTSRVPSAHDITRTVTTRGGMK